MTATDSNIVQMSHDDSLENSFRVCNTVASIAAVLLVDVQAKKVQGRRFRLSKRTSCRCTRHF